MLLRRLLDLLPFIGAADRKADQLAVIALDELLCRLAELPRYRWIELDVEFGGDPLVLIDIVGHARDPAPRQAKLFAFGSVRFLRRRNAFVGKVEVVGIIERDARCR